MSKTAENSSVNLRPDYDSELSGSNINLHDVMVCDICGDVGRQHLLASCSRCSNGAEHTYCMKVMLEKVPEDEWFCEGCRLEFDAHKAMTEILKSTIVGEGNSSKAGLGLCNSIQSQLANDRTSSMPAQGVENSRDIGRTLPLSSESCLGKMDLTDEKYAGHTIIEDTDDFSTHCAMPITASSSLHQLIQPEGPLSQPSNYSDRQKRHGDTDKDGLWCTPDKSVAFRNASSMLSNTNFSESFKLTPSGDMRELKPDTGNYPRDERISLKSALNRAFMLETAQAAAVSCKDSVSQLNKEPFSNGTCITGVQHSSRSNDENNLKDSSLNSGVRQPAVASPKSVVCVKCNSHCHTSELCPTSDLQLALIKSRAAKSLKERSNKTIRFRDVKDAARSKHTLPINASHNVLGDLHSDTFSINRVNNHISDNREKASNVSDVILSSIAGVSEGHCDGNVPVREVTTFAKLDPCASEMPGRDFFHNDLLPISVIPELDYIWQGRFELLKDGRGGPQLYDGMQAHLSSFAPPKVTEVAKKFPHKIQLEEVCRLSIWPQRFLAKQALEEQVGLYIFAKDVESYYSHYEKLVNVMMTNDLALKGMIDGIELSIYCSILLPAKAHCWNKMFYLWAVFQERFARRRETSEIISNSVAASSGISQESISICTLEETLKLSNLPMVPSALPIKETVCETAKDGLIVEDVEKGVLLADRDNMDIDTLYDKPMKEVVCFGGVKSAGKMLDQISLAEKNLEASVEMTTGGCLEVLNAVTDSAIVEEKMICDNELNSPASSLENVTSNKQVRSDCSPLKFDLNEISSCDDMLVGDERCIPSFEADSGSTKKFFNTDFMLSWDNNEYGKSYHPSNSELALERGSSSDKVCLSDEGNDSPDLSLSIALPHSSEEQTAQLKPDQLLRENESMNPSIVLFGKLIKM